jgi:hypothetical protein
MLLRDGDTPYYLESASDDDGENKGDNGDSQTSTKNTND